MWKLHIFMPTKSDTVEPVSSGWSLKLENSPPPPPNYCCSNRYIYKTVVITLD